MRSRLRIGLRIARIIRRLVCALFLPCAGFPGVLAQGNADTGAKAHSSALAIVPVDTRETIRAVRIDPGSGDLWLLTETAIHHRRGTGPWEKLAIDPARPLVAIHVPRPGVIYATTFDDEVIVHRDGHWSDVGRLKNCVSGDWRRIQIEGLGNTLAVSCPYYSGLASWNADDPATFTQRTDVSPHRIAVVGAQEVLSLGRGWLHLVRLDQNRPLPLSRNERQQVLWADRSRIVTAGPDGEFRHATWNPEQAEIGSWTIHKIPGPTLIADIRGWRHDNLIAVGQAGTVLRFDGHAWSALASPVTTDLFSVAVDNSGFWIGGGGGTLLHLPAGR